jgi:hypothetical protein
LFHFLIYSFFVFIDHFHFTGTAASFARGKGEFFYIFESTLCKNFVQKITTAHPLPRSSTPNCHWPPGWDIAGERARPGCRFRRRARLRPNGTT